MGKIDDKSVSTALPFRLAENEQQTIFLLFYFYSSFY